MWLSFRSSTLVLILVTAVHVNAQERKFTIGPRLDLVAGGGNEPNLIGLQQSNGLYSEVYPALEMRSTGEGDAISASYAFGYHRTITGSPYNSKSHVASVAYSTTLSPAWKLNVSDSFQMTSDLIGFNSTRGDISPIGGSSFLFAPVSTGRSTRTNTAAMGAEYRWSGKSTLSFNAANSVLNYGDNTGFNGVLSNQQRLSTTVTYAQRVSQRSSWTAGYTGTVVTFQDFDTTTTHAASLGYLQQLGHDLTLQVSGGPSYVQSGQLSNNYTGYNSAASLQQVIKKKNTMSVYYSYLTGSSSGLGSVSDTRSAGFGWTRLVGREMTVYANLSAFDSKSRSGNIYNTRGFSAAATFGMPITRELSLNAGGQYQQYDQSSPFGFNQKRIFISLRYNAPELWKFTR
jgi:hypothetical protein